MQTLQISKIPDSSKTEMTDHLAILLFKILPSLNRHIAEKRSIKNTMVGFFVAGGIALFLGIILAATEGARPFGVLLIIAGIVMLIIGFTKMSQLNELRFANPVKRIGKTVLGFGLYPFEDGALLIDEKGVLVSVSISFPNLKDFDTVKNLRSEYRETMSKLPMMLPAKNEMSGLKVQELSLVDSAIFSSENKLQDLYQKITSQYQSSTTVTANLGLLEASHPVARHLLGTSYTDVPGKQQANKETAKVLAQVMGVISDRKRAKESVDIDDYSLGLLKEIAVNLMKMSKVRSDTLVTVLKKKVSRIGDIMHYSAYSYYCPHCNQDVINDLMARNYDLLTGQSYTPVTMNPNSRMQLIDWETELWKCSLCEKETRNPIPVHKMVEQVFSPAYNYLMLENEKDRMKYYAELKDKLVHYKQQEDKEKDEVFRTNRSELDAEKYKMRSLRAQIDSNFSAIQQLGAMMAQIQMITEQELARTSQFARDIANKIRAEQQQIEQEMSRKTEQMSRQIQGITSKYASMARQEQQERDKVQQQIAGSLSSIDKNVSSMSANDLARARKEGLHDNPWFRPDKNLPKFFDDLHKNMVGESDAEAASRALRK